MPEPPTLCMIFEAIGPYSAIGRVAMQGVQLALDAGWKVTVVAKRLDEGLQNRVEWLKLYVPPKLFALQWTTARYFIKKALGDRKFDVVHAHQPQVADLSDLFQCHYLTRAAYERNSLTRVRDLRTGFIRVQEQVVLRFEDFFYSHWNPTTRMLYDSALTRSDFHRLYDKLPREDTFVYAFPDVKFPTSAEREQARIKIFGSDAAEEIRVPVLGYLGGLHERKGYRRILANLETGPEVFLLMGGQYSHGFEAPRLAGRFKAMGLVEDIRTFYHACDAFVVASYYEPLGLVAFEASAHGLPVVATEEVGALPHLIEYEAGVSWDGVQPLSRVVLDVIQKREHCNAGARRMEQDLGVAAYGARLLREYDSVKSSPEKSSRLQSAQ